jgi:hypothetical protein
VLLRDAVDAKRKVLELSQHILNFFKHEDAVRGHADRQAAFGIATKGGGVQERLTPNNNEVCYFPDNFFCSPYKTDKVARGSASRSATAWFLKKVPNITVWATKVTLKRRDQQDRERARQ